MRTATASPIRGDWATDGAPSIVGHYSLADFGELAVEKLNKGQPLIVNDSLADLAPEAAKTFQDIGIAATICMPLIKEGKLTRAVTERSWAHIQRVRSDAELRSTAAASAISTPPSKPASKTARQPWCKPRKR